MGVYIKEVDYPMTCGDCIFCGFYQSCGMSTPEMWCGVTCENLESLNYKPKSCPLIEVKTPHGRLVDESEIHTGIRMEKNTEHRYFIDKVNAPTVIEAEVE